MNKNISKKYFIEKLKFYLSFYFNEEESTSILHDYEEWFINETLHGKSEKEICFSLNSPKKVVNNLLVESGNNRPRINILLQNTIIQTLLLLISHSIISILLLKTCNRVSFSYLFPAFSIILIYFIIGIVFIKAEIPHQTYFDKSIFYKSNLFVFGFAIIIVLFQIFFLPKINYIHSGKIYFFSLSIFILCLFLFNLYIVVIKLFQVKQLAFLTTLHILGVTTLLFYTINQLNMLYNDMSQCIELIYGNISIYLETVILCYIFCIQKHIRK